MRARSIFMAHTGIKFKANAKRKRLNAAVKIQRQSLVGLWKKIYEKLAFVVMAVMSLLVLSVVVVASYASRGCTSKQDNMVETHTHTLTRNESKLAHTYTHAEKSPRTEMKMWTFDRTRLFAIATRPSPFVRISAFCPATFLSTSINKSETICPEVKKVYPHACTAKTGCYYEK